MPRKNSNASHVTRTKIPAVKTEKAKPDPPRGEIIVPRVHGGYRHSFQIDDISPGRLVAVADYKGAYS